MSTVDQFLMGYKASTARVYAGALEDFERITGVPVEQATQDDVLRFQESLEGLAGATIRRKLSTLSALFRHMTARGLRTDNPMAAVRIARYRTERPVQYLEPDEVRALMAACQEPREKALVAILLHGCRISEAVGLDVPQVRDGALLGILGKGDKLRSVPLRQTAQTILAEYIGSRTHGPLLLNRSRRRLSVRRAADLIYDVSTRAGRRVNPHRLRHTFGRNMIRDGVGLAHLQDLLGHASPQTTRVYSVLTVEDYRGAVESVDLLGEEVGPGLSSHPVRENYPAPKASYKLTLIQGGRDETPPHEEGATP